MILLDTSPQQKKKKNHSEDGSHFAFILHIIWHVAINLSSFKMLLIREVDFYYTLNSSASSWNMNTYGTSVICWYGEAAIFQLIM